MQWVVSLCRMYSKYHVLCSIWLVVTAGGHVVPTERQNSLSDVSLAATCSNWAPKWPRHITAGWTRYTDRPIPNSIPLPLVMTKYTHWPAQNILLGNWLWNAKASYTRILNHDVIPSLSVWNSSENISIHYHHEWHLFEKSWIFVDNVWKGTTLVKSGGATRAD